MGFPGGAVVKNPPANAEDVRDMGSIPGLGRSPREGNDNPLQYSCLENPMDRRAWWATVHGVTQSWTWLSDLTHFHCVKWASPVAQLVKNLPANAGDVRDMGSIPGLGRSLGEGNSNPLQYSCLENSMDRGAWWATVHGVAGTTEFVHTHMHACIK